MIEQKTPECTLGLTLDILSAWRDGDLRSDETQRIRAHTATCTACQQRLAGFAMVARALGRQQELETGDRVWRGVQDRIAAQTHRRSDLMRVAAWNWRGLAAVASLILVVGLLAYVLSAGFSQRGGPTAASTATVTPTPISTLTSSTVVPGPRLVWQQTHGYPPGASQGSDPVQGPAVAPGDGDVAYTLTPPSQGSIQAQSFVTRDRGATWPRAGAFAVGSQPSTQDVTDLGREK